MEEKSGYILDNGKIAKLLGASAIAELVSFIPFAGDVISIPFWLAVTYYLFKLGFGWINGRRLVTEGISMVAEMIPAVQELPTFIVAMTVLVIMIRLEEKTGISVTSLAKGKVGSALNHGGTRLPPPRMPANQGEIRPPNGGLAA